MTISRNKVKQEVRKRLGSIDAEARKELEVVKKSLCSKEFFKAAVKTVVLVLLYYIFSITLTFYNKKFIQEYKMPLSITMFHLTIKFFMAAFVRWLLYVRSGEPRTMLSWKMYATKVAPPGVFSSLDIALSNWSFEFITVSLYTMTKSTVIVFILIFAIAFRLEKLRCSLVFVVLFIAAGLFLFTYQSTQFVLKGFLMVLGASVLSGLRWALAQIVLQKNEIGLGNPVDMIYHIQPWMIAALFPLSISFEGLFVSCSSQVFGYHQPWVLLENVAILMAGASIAFCMEFAEFLLVQQTSSLTLSIAGIVKEIATLVLATQINGDQLSPLNTLGLVTCLCGITLHVVLKAVHQGSAPVPRGTPESIELMRTSVTDSDTDSDVTEHVVWNRR